MANHEGQTEGRGAVAPPFGAVLVKLVEAQISVCDTSECFYTKF